MRAVNRFLGHLSKTVASVVIATLSAFGSAQAAGPVASNSPPHSVAVVELFTSEGCSSCPPADALLRRLADRNENGTQIIVLSEHVTYWNRLGWTDPFSSDILTNRQNRYADRFHLDSVYTPQIVVNGREQVLGSEESAVLSAIRRQPAQPQLSLQILSIRRQGAAVHVGFAVAGELLSQADVFAALVDDTDTSQISRGENSGRALTHVNVVRTWVPGVQDKVSKTSQVVLHLPAGDKKQLGKPRHVVLLAQLPGQGAILTATTAPVPEESN